MSQDALGPQFAEHVASFRDRHHERWSTKQCAAGQCIDASHEFQEHLERHGTASRLAYFSDEHPHPDRASDHYVNVVSDRQGQEHVVDWTHRQFDPAAKVPHVEPYRAYVARLGMGQEWG